MRGGFAAEARPLFLCLIHLEVRPVFLRRAIHWRMGMQNFSTVVDTIERESTRRYHKKMKVIGKNDDKKRKLHYEIFTFANEMASAVNG
jgi:hypothetical protein